MNTFQPRGVLLSVLTAASVAVLIALIPNAVVLQGQSVLGIGEDATVTPRGLARLTLATSSTRFDSRYGFGRGQQSVVPLGFHLTFDSVGVAQLPSLLPIRAALRQITGLSTLDLSLGRSITRVDATIQSFPLALELGLASRLSIGVLVPIVRTRSEVSFNANPQGSGGNLGFNPALSNTAFQDQNDLLFAQLDAASTALSARINECQATPSAPGCSVIIQRGPTELAITTSLLSGLRQVYGTSTFVPIAGSAADSAIRQNILTLAATYTDVFGLRDSANQPLITSAGPASARTIVGADFLNATLTDPDLGLGAEPLQTIVRTGIGDIEVSAKLQLINTLNEQRRLAAPGGMHFRTAITGIARLGTGTPELPDNLVDIGTGDGQNDIEARSQSDFVLGQHFWFSVIGRYGWQLADETLLRITDQSAPIAAAFRQQLVSRDLGDYLEVEVTPRFIVNDFLSVSGQFTYRRKAEDRHTGRFDTTDVAGDPITLDASILDAGTDQRESRVSGGIAYSTVAAHQRRRARYPLEIFVQHVESVSGSGANIPKIRQQIVQLRLYMPIFGKR